MTEDEWNSGIEPSVLLDFLQSHQKASERKLRLFAVACCRQVWYLLATNESRQAVELSERAADDPSVMTELAAMCRTLWESQASGGWFYFGSRRGAAHMAAALASTAKMSHVHSAAKCTQTLAALPSASASQCLLLRDIIGPLPFRSVPIDESWLHWSDATIPKIAQAIYDERRFEDVPILADALEESGCSDAELLGHLRCPGPHVKGCWAIDLLLGKQ